MWNVLAREQCFKAGALMRALRKEGVKGFLPDRCPERKADTVSIRGRVKMQDEMGS